MRVSELIEELKKLNQDDRVYWWNGYTGEEINTVEENDDGCGTFVTVSYDHSYNKEKE